MQVEQVEGNFDIELSPQTEDDINMGRMLINKTYHGDLIGKAKGQMLSHRTTVDGSAGYVAIEAFTGSLQGKSGSFVLQHTGLMDRGASSLEVAVIPDSGTDELEGLTGKMQINISEGKHSYVFDFSINRDK